MRKYWTVALLTGLISVYHFNKISIQVFFTNIFWFVNKNNYQSVHVFYLIEVIVYMTTKTTTQIDLKRTHWTYQRDVFWIQLGWLLIWTISLGCQFISAAEFWYYYNIISQMNYSQVHWGYSLFNQLEKKK